jgi:hypothetical protein
MSPISNIAWRTSKKQSRVIGLAYPFQSQASPSLSQAQGPRALQLSLLPPHFASWKPAWFDPHTSAGDEQCQSWRVREFCRAGVRVLAGCPAPGSWVGISTQVPPVHSAFPPLNIRVENHLLALSQVMQPAAYACFVHAKPRSVPSFISTPFPQISPTDLCCYHLLLSLPHLLCC